MAKKEYTVKLTRHTTPLPPEQVYAFRYALEKLAGLVRQVREKEKGQGETPVPIAEPLPISIHNPTVTEFPGL